MLRHVCCVVDVLVGVIVGVIDAIGSVAILILVAVVVLFLFCGWC